jgi:putative oxidoreductase
MDVVARIGRMFFSLIFLVGGAGHLTSTAMVTDVARSKKVPAARLVVVVSGVVLAVWAVMIVFGIWADLAALLLVFFLLPTAVVMQNFWTGADPQILVQMHYFKDLLPSRGRRPHPDGVRHRRRRQGGPVRYGPILRLCPTKTG